MKKLLSNQINPHFKLLDSLHAIGSLLAGKNHKSLNTLFEETFKTKNIFFTNTARSALGLICETVKPDPSKRIALPAFICAVVATPFLARGYKIEWIETDDNGVIDVKDFESKAAKVSMVVVPHIFGQSAPLQQIAEIAKLHNIFVIEDGAHLIRQFQPYFKTLADAQILSFGREKVISCVSGGALIWKENSAYHEHFKALETRLKKPSLGWVVRHTLQPLIFSLSLCWWHQGGKIIPWLALKLKLLPLAVTPLEKKGQEDTPLTRLGLPQKRILARQIKNFDRRAVHAQSMALAWEEVLKPLWPEATIEASNTAFRFLIKKLSPTQKEEIIYTLKQRQAPYHLSDWDGVPISPSGVLYSKFGYKPGQCPNAEYFARTYLTFPTNIRTQKANIKAFAKYINPT